MTTSVLNQPYSKPPVFGLLWLRFFPYFFGWGQFEGGRVIIGTKQGNRGGWGEREEKLMLDSISLSFLFIPRGKQSNLMNIFVQVGWLNHQLGQPRHFLSMKKGLFWLFHLGFKAISFQFSKVEGLSFIHVRKQSCHRWYLAGCRYW